VPPDGYNTITVNKEVSSLLLWMNMIVKGSPMRLTASIIALDYDEAELAQLLADRLKEWRDIQRLP